MRTRTHAVVANTLALAALNPSNLKELGICMVMATIGGTVCDLDVRTSESHKKVDILITLTLSLLLIGYYIDYKNNYGISSMIMNSNYYISILGLILFMIICFIGMHKPHRSFLHSLLCLTLFSGILLICFDNIYLPFLIGFISHIVLDIFNKRGVRILYPLKKGFALGLCRYDSKVDDIIFTVSTVLLIILLFI